MDASHVHDGKKTTSLLDLPEEVCTKKNVETLVFCIREGEIQGVNP